MHLRLHAGLRGHEPVCALADLPGGGDGSFAAVGWLVQGQAIALPLAAAAALAALVATICCCRGRARRRCLLPLPWWDIPARMLMTFALVAVIMLERGRLGPQLSGIVSTYPVILIVIGSFTHQQWGVDAVWRVLRGLTVSLAKFVAFFLVVGLTMPGRPRAGLRAGRGNRGVNERVADPLEPSASHCIGICHPGISRQRNIRDPGRHTSGASRGLGCACAAPAGRAQTILGRPREGAQL